MAFIRVAVIAVALGCVANAVDEDDAKNRPVTKVINLLKDMVVQLEKEGEEDADIYEKMGCWCETNEKEKSKSISDAESRIQTLTADIESLTSASARLNSEITKLNEEVAKNDNALDEATEMRRKELAEFNKEEKENLQTINSLKSAVIALSKHHEASLIQEDTTEVDMNFLTVAAGLQSTLHKHADVLSGVFTARQRSELAAFAKSPQDYFGKTEISLIQTSDTAPASGAIFGMLKQMKETFETNLANSQKEEEKSQSDFENLKKTKKEEIAAGTAQSETKTQELADADEKNAQSKEDLEDTQRSLAADTEFMATLKEKCSGMDAEFEERTKTRQMEIQAVSKALAFLNSDEAHDLFSRTFNMAFLQTNRRVETAKMLSEAGQKFKDRALSKLAAKVAEDPEPKNEAFYVVNKQIQDMVDKLTKEKEDEIKHKAFCVEELGNNERDIATKEREKADLDAKIADLEQAIDQKSKEIETLKAEVAELQVQIKRAGNDRERGNKEFQVTVADQKATQRLLSAALNILKDFYDKMSLVQKKALLSKQPSFKKYEKNENSGGVMGMMQSIINDAKAMEAEAIRGEEDSQKAYEDFVKDSNMSIEAKLKDVVNKSEVKAKLEKDKAQAKTDLKDVLSELDSLQDENADLHKSCDFTLKNFDIRQTARDDEIGALKQAIQMFSGASFAALLQDAETPKNQDSDDGFFYDGNAFAGAH